MRKYIIILLSLFCMGQMTGCGSSEELFAFQENINSFYTEVSEIESSIEQIDVANEEAVTTLLISMEQMLTQFELLAQMEVPVEFTSVGDLADDAFEYMTEAVRLYEEAFAGETVNDGYVQAAVENYESAMKRVNYIALLLKGEVPEGAVVIETEGNEFEPYTEGE